MKKPILLIDFDGVIHSYKSGWKGADVIADGPVDGAKEFLIEASNKFSVCVYSSRSRDPAAIKAMKAWIEKELGHRVLSLLDFPEQKPAAFLTIDDRCICFRGKWPSMDEMLNFQPWNKDV